MTKIEKNGISFIEKAIPLTQLLDMQIGDKLREILSEQ